MTRLRPILIPLCLALLSLLPRPVHATPVPERPFLHLGGDMHSATIYALSVSTDGTLIATASLDKTVRLWNAANGTLVRVLRPPIGDNREGALFSVAFSPDGTIVACAGWTGYQWAGTMSIYFFDTASGHMIGRLGGLPQSVAQLAFSPDGRRMAVMMAYSDGIALFERPPGERLWTREMGSIRTMPFLEPGKVSQAFASLDFSPDGRRLVAVSEDSLARLFDLEAQPNPEQGESWPVQLKSFEIPLGRLPAKVRFSPDGSHIAVGFKETTGIRLGNAEPIKVAVLSASTLEPLYYPDLTGVAGDISAVAWSPDGSRLYGSGTFSIRLRRQVRVWEASGRGSYRDLPLDDGTVTDMRTLPGGGVVTGSELPSLAILDRPGAPPILRGPDSADLRVVIPFLVSPDGSRVQFSFQPFGFAPGCFSITERSLTPGSCPPQARAVPARLGRTGDYPYYSGFSDDPSFRLDKQTSISLEQNEKGLSHAFAPDGASVVLGTNFGLKRHRLDGSAIWSITSPAALHVNISGDGRVVVAAMLDGTIRWYRMSDGKELVALFPHRDRTRWLLWTPEGYFDAVGGGEELVGFRLNRGPDREGRFIGLNSLYDVFYRPDIVQAAFRGDDTAGLITLTAEQALAAPPPTVTITTPPAETAGPAWFCYRVEANGGGIGEVRIFLNGKLVRSDGFYREAGQRPEGGGQKLARLDGTAVYRELRALAVRDRQAGQTVTVAPKGDRFEECSDLATASGENQLSVAAFNSANTVQSALASATFRSLRPPARPRLFVLAFGIDTFGDPGATLRYAVRDASDLSRALAGNALGLFAREDIHVRLLTNQQAGRSGILQAVAAIAAEAGPEDTFVLFAASHGVLNRNQYQLVTADFGGDLDDHNALLGANELVDISKRVKALRQLFIFDTCHAGGVDSIISGLYDARMSTLAKKMGLQVFASASSQQAALDGYRGNGLFTHTLLTALKELRNPKGHPGTIVTATDVGQRARALTTDISRRLGRPQTPLIIGVGSDVPLFKAGAP